MTPFKENITEEQYQNCKKLIEYCSELEYDTEQLLSKGLSARSILWWNVEFKTDHPYNDVQAKYGINGLNIHEYESRWVYNYVWSENTPQVQAKRLQYLLEVGLPDQWQKDYHSVEFTSSKYEHIWKQQ